MNILVVDDHALVREGLSLLLQGLTDAEPVTVVQAETCAQALERLSEWAEFDLAVLDYHLPDMTGLALLPQLTRVQPSLPVVILSGSVGSEMAARALAAGAAGFVTKSGHSQDLLNALRRVLAGEIVSPQTTPAPSPPAAPHLTKTQLRVLTLLLEGLTNREICTQLHVSEETVKTHVKALLRIFAVKTRLQLALEADRWGYAA